MAHHQHLQLLEDFDHVPMKQPRKSKYSLLDRGLLMLEKLTQILLAASELQESVI